MSDSKHTVIIGGGITGAVSAIELLRDGHTVTLVEPGPPGGEQSASYGNGTLLNPGSVVPVSLPGLWKKVPGYLMDPLGPLTISWSYLAKLTPWLLRFIRAGATEDRVMHAARALKPLIADAPERHRALAEEAGVGDLIKRQGVLYPFLDRAAFEADAVAWRVRRNVGITWTELDEDALRQQEPGLDRKYKFAVFMPQAANIADPGAYVAALTALAESQGMRRVEAQATGFERDGARLRAVQTTAGPIPADAAVISAGARSAAFAHQLGDRVSLETERGYHIVAEGIDAGLRHPMLTSDTKIAVVGTNAGLRVAGTVELAGLEAAPNWERARRIRTAMEQTLPNMPKNLPDSAFKFWMGHRPSTPDGVPVIGRASACPDVIHAYGHGHIGLVSGAMTGRLVADLVSGKPPSIDITPFSPQRFN